MAFEGEWRSMQNTRRQIMDLLQQKSRASVKELARELGLSAMGVRQHLMVLEAQGMAYPAEMRRGTGGRPHALYALTEQGRDSFPKRYHYLADSLLEMLTVLDGVEKVNQVLEAVAEHWASQHSGVLQRLPLEDRVRELTRILNDEGRSVEWGREDGGFALSLRNCPFHRVTQRYPQLCHMDHKFLIAALGEDVDMVKSQSQGEESCAFFVRPPVKAPAAV